MVHLLVCCGWVGVGPAMKYICRWCSALLTLSLTMSCPYCTCNSSLTPTRPSLFSHESAHIWGLEELKRECQFKLSRCLACSNHRCQWPSPHEDTWHPPCGDQTHGAGSYTRAHSHQDPQPLQALPSCPLLQGAGAWKEIIKFFLHAPKLSRYWMKWY